MSPNSAQKVLLVVEDDADVSLYLKALLQREGYDVHIANDGYQGLQVLHETAVDLVLLDWMMPGINGIEVLKRMRQSDDPPPVLMLSAKGRSEEIMGALHEGAIDYVQKPVQRETLLFKITQILEKDTDRVQRMIARRTSINMRARVPFVISEITSEGCLLESTFPIDPGSVLFLTSDDLAKALDQNWGFRLTVRVNGCTGEGTRYQVYADHVSLSPQVASHITRLNQKKAWPR